MFYSKYFSLNKLGLLISAVLILHSKNVSSVEFNIDLLGDEKKQYRFVSIFRGRVHYARNIPP